ncbi:MAG TPA: PTS sugar transporter subunit IIC [Erysipelotrichaceae bacterium]|nr:PTS sugar transporter subunit IIC [Erysipelotrichaceae bacterium]
MEEFKQKFIAVISKIASNKFLLTLRDTFVLVSALPLIAGLATMVSSVFLDPNGIIFGNSGLHLGALIFGGSKAFLASGFAKGLTQAQTLCSFFSRASISINAVLIVVAFAYILSKRYFKKNREPIITVFYALGAFFVCLPWNVSTIVNKKTVTVDGIINSNFLGTQGIFTALLISGVTVVLYNKLLQSKFKIKMPASVPPAVAKSFESLIPGTITLLFFILLTGLSTATTGKTLPELLLATLQQPAMAISRTGAFAFISQFTWSLFQWFGIHPSSIWGAIFGMTWDIAGNENVLGTAHHVYSTLFMNFSTIAAGTFALAPVLAIMLFSKQKSNKTITKIAFMPAIFNISEPITFGLPIVLNPIYFIPFVIVQPLCFYIAVFFTKIGFIAPIANNVPWTVPPIISGILFSGSLAGGIVQAINLAVATLIYVPFVKISDRLEEKKTTEEEKEKSTKESKTVTNKVKTKAVTE